MQTACQVLKRTMSTQTAPKGYSHWIGPSQCPTPVAPRSRIPPLLPPKATTCPNPLPDRPDPPSLPPGFKRSRHIVPAAYPRSFVESTGELDRGSTPFTKTAPRLGESSDQRKSRNLGEARECVRQRFEATPQADDGAAEPQLWLAGECWRRTSPDQNQAGMTLVVSAANGFTKEVSRAQIRISMS